MNEPDGPVRDPAARRTPRGIRRSVQFLLLLIVILLAALGQELFARRIISHGYQGAWEYRWGQSPAAADGALAWTKPEADPSGWAPTRTLWNPPDRGGSSELWLRTRLPGPEVPDARFYVWALDQIGEAYLDAERVAAVGAFDGEHALRFVGYQPLAITLPAHYQGRYLVLRVHSSFLNIGLVGQPILAGAMDVAASVFRVDISKLAFGTVFAFVGIVSLIIALPRRPRRVFGSFGYFSLCIAAYCLCRANARQWLIDAPLAWSHVELLSLNLLPITGFYFMHTMFGRTRFSPFRIAQWVCTLYLVGAGTAVTLGLVDLWWTLPPFQVIMLLVLPLLVAVTARLAWNGDQDAQVFMAGFLSFVVLGVVETLRGMGVLPQTEFVVLYWGAAALLLSLGYVAVRREARQTAHAIRVEAEHAMQQSRLEEQQEIVEAVTRMSSGDLNSPVSVGPSSSLRDVASQIEALRSEILAKFRQLETRNAEIQSLNRELRRQIQQRSRSFLQSVLASPSGFPLDPGTTLEPGQRIGDRYHVIRCLGRGGMGAVYEVERAEDGARLAAKLLLTQGQRDAVARFAREAEILARVEHPNLVSILDVEFGQQGLLCIVMELVPGAPLSEFAHRAGDPAFVLPVLEQLSDALSVIHEHGIVHRDIKPSNVLVFEQGDGPHVKLADFGISSLSGAASSAAEAPALEPTANDFSSTLASATQAAEVDGVPSTPKTARQSVDMPLSELTLPGMFLGTPQYMAPELALDGSKVSPAADVFSLGIIACELLTGRHPFGQPSFLVPKDERSVKVRSAREGFPDFCPASMADAVESSLSWNPEDRPRAAAFREAMGDSTRR